MSRAARSSFPVGWESEPDDEYDYYPLRLPPEITRITASLRLSIQAEFGGWELTRVRVYTDGSRRVLLRRKKLRGSLAGGPFTVPVI
ncbi:hypothetical protein DE4585_03560 [Mycobacteroides salmoniphilum]|uniref:Dihydroorotate dehydrogenase n=1 Tax=Mycobacteroides salmoniphilum TaxID=404941 RepID=A0A4R8RZ27_9MYCO|nr:DUF5703 family protein [Mycobacteroides salmoniphilum]TDZ79811.1 hypothetical protein DE4585_03560 [Mycobacteroides salmoniphilum]TDZ81861.1 hypothetical protein DE4586_01822 [Mycobacteroides salmoniphilum]TDZ89361.1 hypothetical protein DE4587_01738 [Mycobacteroides salmoniphilum]